MGYYERKVGRLHAATARNDVEGIKKEQKATRTTFNEEHVEGAGVNARDGSGLTPLMTAAKSGSRDALLYLLSQAADVNLRDPLGRSALSYAAEQGHRDIIAPTFWKNRRASTMPTRTASRLSCTPPTRCAGTW